MQIKKITELNRISIEEFKEATKIPLTIILDNVRSLNNIGSVFRTSDAFLVEKIILCGITATPPHPDIHKTALGAEYSVDWAFFGKTTDAINSLKAANYVICAIEQTTDSIMLDKLQPDKSAKYALILGNEVKGVSQDVVNMCDMCIEIPQHGTKHSLNVSVAAGIVIWSFFEKLKQ